MNPSPSDSPSYKGRPIRSIESLAKALCCKPPRLTFVSARASDLYRIAQEIPKADGTVRRTYDAKKLLKDLHRLIKTEILDRVEFPPYLTGSIRGRDYKTNAEIHVGAAIIIAEDIGNFFPSTTAERVLDVWRNFFRFSAEAAQCLTSLTTRNNELPQGAITSPQLANLVFWRNEPQLHDRLKAEGVAYSRFVDDVAASSTWKPLLMTREPFDTPAARAAQGERKLTRWVSRKNPVRAEPVEAWTGFPPANRGF